MVKVPSTLRKLGQWWRIARPDIELAEVEGRAAGTGLLTGEVVRNTPVADLPCPVCHWDAEVKVIDLVTHRVTRRCTACGHQWESYEALEPRVRS